MVAILGPTAIGKSGVAIELARSFGTSIINADSRQFYREMQIGTARPLPEEQGGVPHYLMGDRSIEEQTTAGDFEKEALALLGKLFQGEDILFLVGGSGLYIDALIEGLDDELPSPDPHIREALNQKLENEGPDPLWKELKEADPEHYGRVDLKNPRRVIRALEVIRSTGRSYSSFRGRKKAERPFTPIKIGLWTERQELHRRIGARVERMFEQGLIDEAKELVPYKELRTLNSVGYQEVFSYLEGKIDLQTARERIARNTRRYAKRQMTWFRKDPSIEWFHPWETERIVRCVEERTGIKARSDRAPSDT